jgi:hypothetical protein
MQSGDANVPTPGDYFVSKRDGWLVAVIWVASAVGLAALMPALWVARSEPIALLGVAAGLAGVGLGPWLLYGTDYAFEGDQLLIRGGPFRWRVPLARIWCVEATHNPLSSPACSLERLLIRYGERKIMISPADRAGFLSRLAVLCPHLRLDGQRLSARCVTHAQLAVEGVERAGGKRRH